MPRLEATDVTDAEAMRLVALDNQRGMDVWMKQVAVHVAFLREKGLEREWLDWLAERGE